jgi:hypothetical protein
VICVFLVFSRQLNLKRTRLALFRFSTLLWFGSCSHCILACFLWSKKRKHSSSNHGLCSFNTYRPRLSLAEVLIFSLMFFQSLFMSSQSFQFSKAANPLEILIWYCFITSSSLSILKWICHNVIETVRTTVQWVPYGCANGAWGWRIYTIVNENNILLTKACLTYLLHGAESLRS